MSQPVMRVLVIDDEPMIAKSIRRSLTHAEVQGVDSGRQALALLAQGAVYDLVLCDLMMPDMTGMEVYDEVRTRFPDLLPRIVFMTGGSFAGPIDKFLAAIPNRHLRKPFSADDVRRLIEL